MLNGGDLQAPLREASHTSDTQGSCIKDWVVLLGVDIGASIVFFYLLTVDVSDTAFYTFLGGMLVLMVVWRVYRFCTPRDENVARVPYTCGYMASGGKELFLVATMHISPRAPRDVDAVIATMSPDIAMIELDEERLDRMRTEECRNSEEANRRRERAREELQPIQISRNGRDTQIFLAQRALWNAEHAGDVVAGVVVHEPDNEYGLRPPGEAARGNFVLVNRGGPPGAFAPFALKAHTAARSGAKGVLVVDSHDQLPLQRLGSATLAGDLRTALKTRSCIFPPIPVLLLSKAEGEQLREECIAAASTGAPAAQAEFQIREDQYPRRTLRKRLCQGLALVFSGIGILYGIIDCFDVEVGAEFLAAERSASARGIPCVCIDVDLNRFWSRLAISIVPTPCNVILALRAWIAFPRVMFQFFYPPRSNVDVAGSTIFHMASLRLRTWIAFVLAGIAASYVTTSVLKLLSFAAEQGAEESGAVSSSNRDATQAWIMLGVQLFLLPRVYDAVAASRDEVMYKSIVAKSHEHQARRLVAVVGAAHSNGILQRVRARGL